MLRSRTLGRIIDTIPAHVHMYLRHRAEEVYSALVDAQDELSWQQADGVLNALDWEEDGVAIRQAASTNTARTCMHAQA